MSLHHLARPQGGGLAAALLVLTLGGCSSAGGSAEVDVPITLERITHDSQSVTPAVALLPDASERQLILLAHDTLLAECVAGQGQALTLSPGDRMPWVDEFVAPFGGDAPFGPVDPERMARFGYHDPEHSPAPVADSEWTGRPTAPDVIRSCDETVTDGLGGEPPYDLKRLIVDAGKRAGGDPRRDAPREAWSACMRKKGFVYSGDRDPWAEFAMSPEGMRSELSPEEVAVATADAECQASARNIDTLVALVVAYEEKALTDNAEQVGAYQDYLDALLRRSAEIVAEKPAPANRREAGADS